MAGDAAGMIPPLCGNGMSMALHAGKIAFELVEKFLDKRIGRTELESGYTSAWQKKFSHRLATGRWLQKITENEPGFSFLIKIGMHFPGLLKYLVRKTHGTSF
jgi:flavin-dependent dehydrogenase